MISVIIPLYNKGKSVLSSLNSVFAQSYDDYEIIIVDDGSTDNSLSVVKAIKDERIHIFSKSNGGVSSARNYAVEKASGEIIAFLDADDLWLPDYLYNVALMARAYPNLGMYIQNQERISIDSLDHFMKRHKGRRLTADHIMVIDNWCKYFEKLSFITSSIAMSKKLFVSSGGFDERLTHGEDIDLWLRAGLLTEVGYADITNSIILYYNSEYHTISIPKSPQCTYSYKWANTDEFPYNSKRYDIQKVMSIGIVKGAMSYRFIDKNVVKNLLGAVHLRCLDFRSLIKFVYLKLLCCELPR